MVGPEGLTIGRAATNEVVIETEAASRIHARIERVGDSFVISDLGSRNGTYLNDERLRNEQRELKNGDVIIVGGETLKFLSGEETRFGKRVGATIHKESLTFDGTRLTVGRDPSNDVVINDPNVSRFHAEIVAHGSAMIVRDLESRNGTRLNGEFMAEGTLEPGSEVGVGSYRLTFDGANFRASDDRGAMRLDAFDVSMEINGTCILRPTSVAIQPGEFVAIIGESGAGKSTLIKALAGVTIPTEGSVLVNNDPVTARLTDIGYVPQDEIVHPRLDVDEALSYAARLRLSDDVTPDEVRATVTRVLSELALDEQAHMRIGSLSGGQRKRAGVAAELLSEPSLLFLDEPTTGLDPGLESRLMALMRDLSNNGRAVVTVTHATKNLALCKKLIVMGRGGYLCFHGAPTEALEFFDVDDFDGIYTALDNGHASEWQARFEAARSGATTALQLPTQTGPPPPARRKWGRTLRQTSILTRRYARLFARDRRNLLILFGQVPLIALAIVFLFKSRVFARGSDPQQAAQLLFLVVTTTIWLGAIDAAREIIKERSVFAREAAVGVRVSAYLLSKVLVLCALAALQTALLALIVFALRPLHEPADVVGAVLLALLLTTFTAVGMGLLVSAVVNTEDQATSFIPLTLIPQLLFAGAIVPVKQMSEGVEALSNAVFSRWSFASLGTAIDMPSRVTAKSKFPNIFGNSFFSVAQTEVWLLLAGFGAVFVVAVGLALRRRLA